MSNQTQKKEGAYAQLTGFRRAVPIILVALAVFTGLCFIMQDTGTLGRAISRLFLGLFSIGGYFIPFFLAIHAVFYPSDIQKKRLVGRIVFTLLTVFTISALAHTVTFFGDGEMVFAPKQYYIDGTESHGGGFIGGMLAFCLTHLFGKVGLIIIAVVMFALYVTYFLAGGKTVFSRLLLRILNSISDFFASSQERKEKNRRRKAAKKEERRREELAAEQDILTDDEFFAADNGMKEIAIPALGILETREDAEVEKDPHLQEKVFHKSEVKEDTPRHSFDYGEEIYGGTPYTAEKTRRVNMDYSTTDSEHGLSVSVEDSAFEERSDDIIYEEPSFGGKEQSADDLFASGGFEAYDVRINEELSNRPSSKAARIADEPQGINEYETSISDITAEDVEKARQRADFEMKKRAAIEAQERYAEAQAELARSKAKEANEEDRIRRACEEAKAESESYRAEIVTEETGAYDAPETAPAYSEPEAYIPEYMKEEREPAAETAESDYTEERAEESETRSASGDAYRRAASFASAISDYEKEKSSTEFKPYSAPTVTQEPSRAPEELITTRAMLDPTPTVSESVYDSESCTEPSPESTAFEYAESENAAEEIYSAPEAETSSLPESGINTHEQSRTVYPSAEGEYTADTQIAEEDGAMGGIDFSDGEEEENEIVTSAPEEESGLGYEEIPPELQNSDVVEQRKMFSFLSDEQAENSEDGEISFPERPAAEIDPDSTQASADEAFTAPEEAKGEAKEEDAPVRPTPRSLFAEKMLAMEKPKAEPEPQPEPEKEPEKPDYSDYVFPSIDLLAKGKFEEDIHQEEEKNMNAEKLVDALQQFNVRISIKGIDRGPRITRYEIVPARGVKVNSVTNLFNDIQLNLGVEGMRMEAPIPGKSAIGVEIPNKKPSTVLLRDLVETDEFVSASSKTMSCLGKDVTGNPVFADIAKMPHVLVAGATGMGKSVCINAILISILYKARPDEVKLIMIDPKKVEFTGYNGIPHLLVPVVTDVKQAAGALMWAVEQMEKRYDLMEALEVRKLDSYNEKVRENPSLGEPLPKIIIVIDELNDIMIQVRKPAEDLIMSIAQKARAVGIHLIIGTQRPSVDVITGVIKANIPSRISCKVASYNDSKTILEQAGAEKLLNNGDMLYIPAGAPKALRVQGAFVTDGEVSAVMKHLKSQAKGSIYDERALDEINKAAQKCSKGKGGDEIDDGDDDGDDGVGILNDQQFLDAVDIAIRSGKISTSLLQRKLSIGYSKAAKYIDYMQDFSIVSEPCGSKPRDVLITKDEWHELLARRSID